MTAPDAAAPTGGPAAWPSLPYAEWKDTYATLHMWTQIVGKIRLAQVPLINHWWNSTLYVTARGLTTAAMPHGQRTFQIDFDFVDHQLRIATSDGATRDVALRPRSVADFYREVMATLAALDLPVRIYTVPQEVPNPIRFERDEQHASYDPAHARRFWQVLARATQVLTAFRARYLGKVSPVHFFWGSFDLAVTRFSGRPAPEHPSSPLIADFITHEAYSHEVSSCGFWPGGDPFPEPIFYAYAYPEPPGYRDAALRPDTAYYNHDLQESLLPYEAMRQMASPDDALLGFAQSTYEAAATLGHWDRAALERPPAPGR